MEMLSKYYVEVTKYDAIFLTYETFLYEINQLVT